jgi:hypothetical protein
MPEGSELTVIGTTAAAEGERETDPWAERRPADSDLALLAGRFQEGRPITAIHAYTVPTLG